MHVVVDALAARTGGGLTYLRSLLPAASEADPELELTVIASCGDVLPATERIRVVQVPTAAALGRRLIWEQMRLAAIARDLAADAIFAPSEIAPLRAGLPLVVGFQNPNLFAPSRQAEPLRQRLRFRALLMAARASARRADVLLFVSEGFRRIAEPRLPRTSAPRFTATVGVDRRFTSAGDAGRFESFRPYVLCVADVYPYKELPVAVEAFATLAGRQPQLRLLLAGRAVDERESGRIDARIRQRGLVDRVLRLDSVPYEEMPSLYRGAACFLFPSVIESLGLPPLEALACGVPVVAAHASVLPAVLNGAASFFPPGDAAEAAASVERALTEERDAIAVASVLARHDPAVTGKALAEIFHIAARD